LWKIDAVEYATLERVDWFNNWRLLEPIGDVPPAEFEQAYYDELESRATDMSIVYQGGSGTAVISQRLGILAVNGGAGETGSVKCDDEFLWTSYSGCKVKISCANTNPCGEVTRTYDDGNWVWYAPNDVQKGDVCLKFE